MMASVSWLQSMAPRGALFQHLADLEQAASRERQLARQRLHQKRSGEILTTYMAFPLKDAQQRMAEGMAIGDAVQLVHVTDNEHDANAIEVRWREQWIGFIPRHLAALLVAEVPDLASGVEAVITELATTTERDAFRLQLSIPIEQASEAVRRLAINADFSWDFDRDRGDDKLRLVVRCSEKSLRDLCEVLQLVATISKSGYSYYPLEDGRSFPWYLSLTGLDDGPLPQESLIEDQIRQAFGVASESALQAERERSFELQATRLAEISERLQESRLAEQALQQEVNQTRQELDRRRDRSLRRRQEMAQQVDAVERERQELQEELSLARQLLDLADKASATALLEKQELEATYAPLENEVLYLRSLLSQRQAWGADSSGRAAQLPQDQAGALLQRMVDVLRDGAAQQTPRQILELVQRLSPGSLVLLPSALKSADEASGFELCEKLFDLVWKLATAYRQLRLQGGPDKLAAQVFGTSAWAAKESDTTASNAAGRAARSFDYKGQPLLMLQHLKIGVKDSPNRTLRLHFAWDPEDGVVVIGHCGPHLFVQGH
jgi:hypothetical protein